MTDLTANLHYLGTFMERQSASYDLPTLSIRQFSPPYMDGTEWSVEVTGGRATLRVHKRGRTLNEALAAVVAELTARDSSEGVRSSYTPTDDDIGGC